MVLLISAPFYPPETIHDDLFDMVSPATIFRLARVSRFYHRAVQVYVQRAFKLEDTLKRFLNPMELALFRQLQERTGALISGSVALMFFDRVKAYADNNDSDTTGTEPNGPSSKSDLDIYVDHRHAIAISAFLKAIGYKYQPKGGQFNVVEAGIASTISGRDVVLEMLELYQSVMCVAGVYDFDRGEKGNKTKVQLITTYASPLEAILNFHSTCVMNAITHEAAYSFFPWETFEKRRFLGYGDEQSKQEARRKYERRGWTAAKNLKTSEVDELKDISPFKPGLRFPGDNKCWKLPLTPSFDLAPGSFEANSWRMEYRPGPPSPIPNDPDADRLGLWFEFDKLESGTLRFAYLVGGSRVKSLLAPVLVTLGVQRGHGKGRKDKGAQANAKTQMSTDGDLVLTKTVQLIRDMGRLVEASPYNSSDDSLKLILAAWKPVGAA